MSAIPVTDGIFWTGAIDWNLRDFHGYETPRGTTYNAYIVKGAEKTALVDTVKKPFVTELLHRVSTLVDPADVDLIVVNHIEPDHNGGLPEVMAAMPNARVVASKPGVAGIAEYHDGLVVEEVGADDVIDLGGKTLRFMPMPMVHWPDSMFTWCEESKTLMPNDAFGQHMASSGRFADEVGMDLSLEELGIYYANILLPLGAGVAKAVEKVVAAGWAPDTIAPSHGVIWRGPASVGAAIDAYSHWTANEMAEKVVVAYGTMWGSTDAMARAVAEGVSEEGVEVALFDLMVSPVAKITTELLGARMLLLGSPTLHHGMLYRVSGYLTYLEGLKPKGRLGGAFGSFGWGGGSTKQMAERLAGIGFEMPLEPLTVKFRPDEAQLEECREWGRAAARAVKGA
jgi:anaerobic nitric oxide reductase flavorubredoxin